MIVICFSSILCNTDETISQHGTLYMEDQYRLDNDKPDLLLAAEPYFHKFSFVIHSFIQYIPSLLTLYDVFGLKAHFPDIQRLNIIWSRRKIMQIFLIFVPGVIHILDIEKPLCLKAHHQLCACVKMLPVFSRL